MFQASSCPSSGATTTAVAASDLLSELGDSSVHGPHSSQFLCCSMYCLFSVVLCICVLYYCPQVATQMWLKNISHHNTVQGKTRKDGPCPVFAGFTLVFTLQLKKKHGKT